ncbi:MAG: serine/threonine-protein kinase [Pirellulaceae bacterium]
MDSCISDDQFAALLGNDLSASQQSIVEQHLSQCQDCQSRLMTLAGEREFAGNERQVAGTDPGFASSERLAAVKSNLLQSRIPMAMPANDKIEIVATPGLQNKLQPSNADGSLGRFGPFEVLRLLGSGGMGAVYEVSSCEYAELVAMKVLQPHAARDKNARARFVREAKHLSIIDHENVVRVLNVAEIQRVPCIVMERVSGRSLQQMIDQGATPLPSELVRQIAIQTAAALATVHSCGILHRDVKPANIMIEEVTGRARLTDFGLAKAMHDVGLTASNAVPGTPEYMSPEQVAGDDVDYRSDLFSLGSSLYFAATGESPFANQNLLQVFRNVSSAFPKPVKRVVPGFDADLSNVIERLMCKEVNERPRDAAALSATLLVNEFNDCREGKQGEDANE